MLKMLASYFKVFFPTSTLESFSSNYFKDIFLSSHVPDEFQVDGPVLEGSDDLNNNTTTIILGFISFGEQC